MAKCPTKEEDKLRNIIFEELNIPSGGQEAYHSVSLSYWALNPGVRIRIYRLGVR
jgi:hypothetical protein